MIPHSFASPELLAHVAYEKYCNGMPLYRQEKDFKGKGWNVAGAEMVGKAFAERAVKAKIADNCYFDRGGYRYHGRVKALCEAIRAGGVRI